MERRQRRRQIIGRWIFEFSTGGRGRRSRVDSFTWNTANRGGCWWIIMKQRIALSTTRMGRRWSILAFWKGIVGSPIPERKGESFHATRVFFCLKIPCVIDGSVCGMCRYQIKRKIVCMILHQKSWKYFNIATTRNLKCNWKMETRCQGNYMQESANTLNTVEKIKNEKNCGSL